MIAVATTLIALAVIGGWAAIFFAVFTRESELKRWKREAERVHAYWENMRRVYRRT